MPRTPIDYSKTMFYKIVSSDLNIQDLYVGHTTDFKRRKSEHKRVCNAENHKKHSCYVYSFIRDNGGWSNFDMILIEQRCCSNRLEAERVERTLIESLSASLNQVCPSRSDYEYKKENQENIKLKDKAYRELHKESISQKRKEHRQTHKSEYSLRGKLYYEANKVSILEKQKARLATRNDEK